MGFMIIDEETVRANPVFGEVVGKMEAKAEAKGEAKGEATAMLTVLEERQIQVADAQRERILAVHDREVLRRWLRAAMHVASAEELFD